MVQQITKGIKITVKTRYNGCHKRNTVHYNAFDYFITIENKSQETVQLTDRFWMIFDALNNLEIVKGKGVVGQTPILKPSDNYTYKSSCSLSADVGAMKGYFIMKNINTMEIFKVIIPTFQLQTWPISN